jgi:hypothetical protein
MDEDHAVDGEDGDGGVLEVGEVAEVAGHARDDGSHHADHGDLTNEAGVVAFGGTDDFSPVPGKLKIRQQTQGCHFILMHEEKSFESRNYYIFHVELPNLSIKKNLKTSFKQETAVNSKKN